MMQKLLISNFNNQQKKKNIQGISENMHKKGSKFQYPHPLIKNLYNRRHFDENNISELIKQKPLLYDTNYTFSKSIKSIISPKLIRISKSKVIPGQKFGILMQPFNPKQQIQSLVIQKSNKSNIQCSSCNGYLNNQTQSLSLYEVKCKICNHVQTKSLQIQNKLEDIPNCYDYLLQNNQNNQDKIRQKNICFVIQASQFNYNYRVNEVIRSCIQSIKTVTSSVEFQRKQSQATTDDSVDNQSLEPGLKSQQSTFKFHQYNIGFIFFNDKNLFVLNQSTSSIKIFNHEFFTDNQEKTRQTCSDMSIISFDQLFRPIQQVTQQTFQIIEDILYQSYLKNTSCLDFVTHFIQKCINGLISKNQNTNQIFQRNIEFNFFVNSMRFTKKIRQKQTQTQPANVINNIIKQQSYHGMFQNIANTVSNKLTNKPLSSSHNYDQDQTHLIKTKLSLLPNYIYFYLPQHHISSLHQVSQKQVIQKLKNNLYRMYPYAQQKVFNKTSNSLFYELYYDLYESMTSLKRYYNVKMKIIISGRVEILGVGNAGLGYRDNEGQVRKVKSGNKKGQGFSQYEILLNSLQATTALPIDLRLSADTTQSQQKKSVSQSTHHIQVIFQYSNSASTQPSTSQRIFHIHFNCLNRPINYHHHIYASLSTYVDDQVLFYFYLRQILTQCHNQKTNHTIIKKLYTKMQQLSQNFKDQYGQIDFHKEYVRIFMYAFMILKLPLINSLDENFYYERHLWMKGSMERFAKMIYPRTYEFNRNKDTNMLELRNVKTAPKYFRTDCLNLFDNGKNLCMIIGEDNTVDDMKRIFGTCFMDEIREMAELPQLSTNQEYRQAIDLARMHHQSNFLPLKIMELYSLECEQYLSTSLYIKDNHHNYMRDLWEMEPLQKNTKRNKK